MSKCSQSGFPYLLEAFPQTQYSLKLCFCDFPCNIRTEKVRSDVLPSLIFLSKESLEVMVGEQINIKIH